MADDSRPAPLLSVEAKTATASEASAPRSDSPPPQQHDPPGPRTFFIRTFGCQMNEADSSEIRDLLLARGLRETADPATADVVIVNTCVVRRKAEIKALNFILELKNWKKEDPTHRRLAVMGCLAAKEQKALEARLTHVDAVIPGKDIARMKRMVADLLPEDRDLLPQLTRASVNNVTGFVTVIRGCNHACSFCIVPYVRGAELSTPPGEVVRQVRELVASGAREVYLLGQSVLDYGRDLDPPINLQTLLEIVHEAVPHLRRIRFITSHPKDLTLDFVQRVKALPRVAEYIHIPIQSGSNRILDVMRREITVEEYKDKVAMIRAELPHAAISSDIIIGHPGETDEDFEGTMRLLEDTQLDASFVFKYSPREHTLSALKWGDPVPPEVKERRFNCFYARLKEIVHARNQRLVGSTAEVLVESVEDGMAKGRLRDYRMAHLPLGTQPSAVRPGAFLNVKIVRAGIWTLSAEKVTGTFMG